MAEAGKEARSMPGPEAAEQQAFTEKYWQARDAGTSNQFGQDVAWHGTLDEVRMWDGFVEGKSCRRE